MPKFNVLLSNTKTLTYDAVEVEADTREEAQRIAEEMANDEELSIDSEADAYSAQIEEVAE